MGPDITISKMVIERGGEPVDVLVEGYVYYSIDNNYGADADGNRAVAWVDVDEVRDVKAYNMLTDEPVMLTDDETCRASREIAVAFLEK